MSNQPFVHITAGNPKIGRTLNVSLRPGPDCGNCAGCAAECYDKKSSRQYEVVRTARRDNAIMARTDPARFFGDIAARLKAYRGQFFRWHVGGDILDQEYLNWMRAIARMFPKIRFMAYTKMYWLDFARMPDNLVVMTSVWPGMPWKHEGNRDMPRFEVVEDENDVPDKGVACPGECEGCRACWFVKDGEVIYNVIHP